MALQNDGEIKLSDIQEEFGGSPPSQLSEYYSVDTEVPVSGVIKFSDFYGASAATHQLLIGYKAVGSTDSYGFCDMDYDGNCEDINKIGNLTPNFIEDGSNQSRIRVFRFDKTSNNSYYFYMDTYVSGSDGREFLIEIEGKTFVVAGWNDWCGYRTEIHNNTDVEFVFNQLQQKSGQIIGVTIKLVS